MFSVVIALVRAWNGGLLFILFLLISKYPSGRGGVRVCFFKSVFLYSFSFSFSLNESICGNVSSTAAQHRTGQVSSVRPEGLPAGPPGAPDLPPRNPGRLCFFALQRVLPGFDSLHGGTLSC